MENDIKNYLANNINEIKTDIMFMLDYKGQSLKNNIKFDSWKNKMLQKYGNDAKLFKCTYDKAYFYSSNESFKKLPLCSSICPACNNSICYYCSKIAYNKNSIGECCLKRRICKEGFAIAKEYGFTFVGGHPMAGKKFSGYKYSTGKLFRDSSMILCPEDSRDLNLFNHIKDILSPCGFGSITICSPEKHDQMIAFTSEMAHIVSNAYIKSPTAREHAGYSAGSYKDMTRVAWLNEDMWTEIFLENKDNLIFELDTIIKYLSEYKDALKSDDGARLHDLLRDGKIAKEEVDGI